MKKLITLIGVFLFLSIATSYSQNEAAEEALEQTGKLTETPGNTKTVLTGAAWFGFSSQKDDALKLNFNTYGFTPVFIWKLSDKLFLESELEIADGNIELEYAKLSYSLNKYMTIGAGRMLTPFGAYGTRWEPAFVERFPNSPLVPDDAYLPDDTHLYFGAIMGMDVSGDLPLGDLKMNYSLFVSNGPRLARSEETGELLGGVIQYENLDDNNANKAIGGRIGFFPLSNSSLELGVSGNTGKVGDAGDAAYKDIAATALAVDLNYTKAIPSIKSIISIKSQFSSLNVDKANYALSDSTTYTFDNKLQSLFVQFSFRPANVDNKILKNIELLYRYNSLTPPKDASWGGEPITRNDIGLCYWLSWRTGLRFAYEFTSRKGEPKTNEFLGRFVMGF
ncbi:MAG: hypothetical protein IPP15_20020 [Saprospiraceae bacterium]|uniref:Phosphate-selective porin O and P n=1 Tax=Candidatus Opimibacter skivensis TaxID=2982028 RepID=A0A9D7T1I7_9BACT|nr:hypothetical protein [Candidatus Opimibacter skivensis]